MRWRGVVVAVVALVVLIAVGLIHAGVRLWPSAAPSCAQPVTGATVAPPPVGAAVSVVDQGFTDTVADGISVGAILQNVSSATAHDVRYTFTLYDAAHRPVPFDQNTAGLTDALIPLLLPGQHTGAGGYLVTDAPVASFDVQVQVGAWSAGAGKIAAVTAEHATVSSAVGLPAYFFSFRYTEHSTNCFNLTAGSVATVFRDGQGKIIGGAEAQPTTVGPGPCATGRNTVLLNPVVMPAGSDGARTEIYPYCGTDRPTN